MVVNTPGCLDFLVVNILGVDDEYKTTRIFEKIEVFYRHV
jgi:hypothetical protein